MSTFFVPYNQNDKPVTVEINGHTVLILCAEEEDLADDLPLIGGASMKEITIQDEELENSELLAELAEDIDGGVVVAPAGVPLKNMIESLHDELPWIH